MRVIPKYNDSKQSGERYPSWATWRIMLNIGVKLDAQSAKNFKENDDYCIHMYVPFFLKMLYMNDRF